MPIAPANRWPYPIDRPGLSRLVRFGRAGGCCERCGRPHGQAVTHLEAGLRWDADRTDWRDGRVRRLRGLPPPKAFEAGRPWLAALCRRCHMPHDASEHRRTRRRRAFHRRASGDLFEGHERT